MAAKRSKRTTKATKRKTRSAGGRRKTSSAGNARSRRKSDRRSEQSGGKGRSRQTRARKEEEPRKQKSSQEQEGGQFGAERLGRTGNMRNAGQGSRGRSVNRDEDEFRSEGRDPNEVDDREG